MPKSGKKFFPCGNPNARRPLKILGIIESIDPVVKHVKFVVGAYIQYWFYTKHYKVYFSVSLQLLKSAKFPLKTPQLIVSGMNGETEDAPTHVGRVLGPRRGQRKFWRHLVVLAKENLLLRSLALWMTVPVSFSFPSISILILILFVLLYKYMHTYPRTK